MNASALLVAVPLVPLLAMAAIIAAHRRPNLRESVGIAAGVVLFVLVTILTQQVRGGTVPSLILAEPLTGLALVLRPEPLGLLFASVASLLWPITTLYALGYMRTHCERHQTRFYTAFAVAIAATMGIALADNLLTLFVFYEILTLATYPLVTHAGNTEARRAGRLYLALLMGSSIGLLLLAMIWTWLLAGTLTFTPGGVFGDEVDNTTLGILLLLFVFGTGKAALMPLHRWLPAAMVAPTPVSALLHAVAVVKAGVFTILKVSVYLFGIDRIAGLAAADWLAALAALTIVVASLIALRKDNFKARLAYSTIAQLAYITLGAMLGVAVGAVGSGLHIAMHAVGKITLFFCAGAVLVTAHKALISELDGVGRRMPWTMAAFTVGAISMIGAPPAAGFISKWYLLGGALQADQPVAILAIVALVASTLLNAAYFMPIVYAAYFKPPRGGDQATHGEAPLPMLVALLTTASLTLLAFLFPGLPLALAQSMLEGG